MITIPEGVTLKAEGKTLVAKGPGGEVRKEMPRGIEFTIDGGKIGLTGKDKAILGTNESIVASMLKGAKSAFRKELKLLYAHFPISIEVKGKDVFIKNFLGEKTPRRTRIAGNTKLEVKGQEVTISGPDKEAVGQTAANLRTAMKIKLKDPRVFQDGIFEPLNR
jgi:large subunit ribosomal protein L6